MLPKPRVEGFRTVDPTDLIDVAEAARGQQRRARPAPFDDRVHDDGRAVNERLSVDKRRARLRQSSTYTTGELARGRQGLGQAYRAALLVEDDHVGKRAADVNPNSQAASLPRA